MSRSSALFDVRKNRHIAGLLAVLMIVGVAAAITVDAPAIQAPVTEAADEATAATTARRQGSRVEAVNLRTEQSQVFANPNGTLTLEKSVVPERVRTKNGWQPVDTTLEQKPHGIAPKSVTADVVFSNGGDQNLVRIAKDDREIALSWPAPLPRPVVDKSSATYPDVLPGADLKLTATATGFAYALVVRSRESAPAEIPLRLTSRNVTLAVEDSGALRAVDAQDRTYFQAPAATMWDADGKQAPVQLKITADTLTLVPDQALVNTATYPVTIDPDLSYRAPTPSHWTLVRRGGDLKNQNFSNLAPRDEDERVKGVARIGHAPDYPADWMDRSIFQFGIGELHGASIHRARFQIHQVWKQSHTCDPNATAWADLHLTGPIDHRTTWNNQPAWHERLDQQRSVAKLGQKCGPDWIGFEVKNRVQQGANESWGTITLGLKDRDEGSGDGGWKRFYAQDVHGTPMYPKLSVEFNRAPETPAWADTDPPARECRWCDGKLYQGASEIRFRSQIHDPEGGQLSAHWRMHTPEETYRSRGDQASGTVFVSDPVPLKDLHGRTATWYAWGHDGQFDSPRRDGTAFVVDQQSPQVAPGVSSPLYPADNEWHGGADVPGQFTFTANGVDDVDNYVYSWGGGPESSVDAQRLGGDATLSLTPPHDGPVDLIVHSVDRAGRRSPSTTHHFYVRAGNGAKAQWALDGTTKDSAFLGDRHGTAHGSPVWTQGAVGAAAGLDGDDWISARSTVTTSTSFAVTAWVRTNHTTKTATIVSQNGQRVSGFSLQQQGNSWVFAMPRTDADNPQTDVVKANVAPHVGVWTHLAGVHDAARGQMLLYVDGELAGSAPKTTSFPAAGDLLIGRGKVNGAEGAGWDGTLDEVRGYDRAIDQESVRQLVRRDNVQVGHWKFDEKTEIAGNPGTTALNAVQGGPAAVLERGASFETDGAIGGSVRLDGTDDRVVVPHVVDTARSFTVSAWVKRVEGRTGTFTVLAQEGEGRNAFAVQEKDGRYEFVVAGARAQTPENSAVAGEWVHLTASYNVVDRTAKLYLGATSTSATGDGAPVVSKGALLVGEGWPGQVDDVRLYSRVLDDSEVRGIVSRAGVTTGSWKLDGTLRDDSGNNRDATAHGVPGWIPGNAPQPDPADLGVLLDGVDDHVSAPNAVDTSKSFAVAAWVKLDKLGGYPAAVAQDGTRSPGFQLQVTPSGHWSFAMFESDVDGGGAKHPRALSPLSTPVNVWTHVIGTYDAERKKMDLYVNGAPAASVDYTSTWNAGGLLTIGRSLWNGKHSDFFPGQIDDVRTYNRPLFDEEARLLAGRDLSLVHNWRLEDSGADSVGSRTGAVNGATFTAGRSGNAAVFDGTGDSITTDRVDLRTDQSFTVSAWAYLTHKNGKVTAVSVDGAEASRFRLGHLQDDDLYQFGAWVFEMPETDTANAQVTKAAVSTLETELNTWVHLAGVYDAQAKKVWLYVNGIRVGDGTAKNTWQASGGAAIGRGKHNGAAAQFWPGRIDDVRVYTGGLDRARVEDLVKSYGSTGPAPKPDVPADGTTVRDETGAVHRFVGGAPVLLSSCEAGCNPVSIPRSRIDQLNGMNKVPADGVTARDDRGRLYKFIGGAPVQLSDCAAGCGTPVQLNDSSIDRLDHMNAVPATGSAARDTRGHTYVFVGGAPIKTDDCGTACGTPPVITNASIDTLNHMRRVPRNNTLLRAPDATVGKPTSVWVLAGGARVKFNSPEELTGTGHRWEDVALVPEKALLKLPTAIPNGTPVRGPDSPTAPLAVGTVVNGAKIWFHNEAELFAAGHRWEDVVRVPWRVLEPMPDTIPDGSVIRAGDAENPQLVHLVVGGAPLDVLSEKELFDTGHNWDQLVLVPARVIEGMAPKIADGTVVREPGSTQAWRIQGEGRVAVTAPGALLIPSRHLATYPVIPA